MSHFRNMTKNDFQVLSYRGNKKLEPLQVAMLEQSCLRPQKLLQESDFFTNQTEELEFLNNIKIKIQLGTISFC